MINRVVLESRHKFVCYDKNVKEQILDMVSEYPAKLDSEEPVVVYLKDSGLPKIDSKLNLDETLIKVFHERYYELLIFLSIVDTVNNQISVDELNNRLNKVFKLCSYIGKREINDINTLKSLLRDSKNMYKDAYIEYMKTGNCSFYDMMPIPFVIIDNLVPTIKEALGLKTHFCFMLELDENISIYNFMAVNDYIASRCNGYLSINILLFDNSQWKCYYSNNGQFVQNIHDYTEVDLRKNKDKIRSRHN